jgi:osmotically inducible lipoprotein OsmB
MKLQKIIVMATLIFLLAGCAGMTRSEQNILGGGVLGAGLGAAIGAATGGNPAAGAAIGGAAGIVGGAIKDSWERSNGYYGY